MVVTKIGIDSRTLKLNEQFHLCQKQARSTSPKIYNYGNSIKFLESLTLLKFEQINHQCTPVAHAMYDNCVHCTLPVYRHLCTVARVYPCTNMSCSFWCTLYVTLVGSLDPDLTLSISTANKRHCLYNWKSLESKHISYQPSNTLSIFNKYNQITLKVQF